MTNSINTVIRALEDFVPNDDDPDDIARIYQIFDGFENLPFREQAADAIFGLIERFPDADFGAPGPLVHELEATPGYEPHLVRSLRRKPTALTVWMLNRILNSNLTESSRTAWIKELRDASQNSMAPESARELAKEFMEFQSA
jgi:hypothetical protein